MTHHDWLIKTFTTHGMSHTRIYKVWCRMKSRCNNSNSSDYYLYGARGIGVCKEWTSSFEMFYKWAKENGYREGLTLDRIDVNGNYEPQNCRWVTMKIQSNNKRNNRLISFNGETRTIAQWSEITGISKDTIAHRLKIGWDTEKALYAPSRKKREDCKHDTTNEKHFTAYSRGLEQGIAL